MFSGNGIIDYDVEAHTLDAHKTSAARQESTTRNLHGSAASTFLGSTANNLHEEGKRVDSISLFFYFGTSFYFFPIPFSLV